MALQTTKSEYAWFEQVSPSLLRNKVIRNFLAHYTASEWPEVVKLTLLHGILGLHRQHKGHFFTVQELRDLLARTQVTQQVAAELPDVTHQMDKLQAQIDDITHGIYNPGGSAAWKPPVISHSPQPVTYSLGQPVVTDAQHHLKQQQQEQRMPHVVEPLTWSPPGKKRSQGLAKSMEGVPAPSGPVYPSWWGDGSDAAEKDQQHAGGGDHRWAHEREAKPPPKMSYTVPAPVAPLDQDDLVTSRYLDVPSSGYGQRQQQAVQYAAPHMQGLPNPAPLLGQLPPAPPMSAWGQGPAATTAGSHAGQMLFALHPSGVMMPVVLPTGSASVAKEGDENGKQQLLQGKGQEKKKTGSKRLNLSHVESRIKQQVTADREAARRKVAAREHLVREVVARGRQTALQAAPQLPTLQREAEKQQPQPPHLAAIPQSNSPGNQHNFHKQPRPSTPSDIANSLASNPWTSWVMTDNAAGGNTHSNAANEGAVQSQPSLQAQGLRQAVRHHSHGQQGGDGEQAGQETLLDGIDITLQHYANEPQQQQDFHSDSNGQQFQTSMHRGWQADGGNAPQEAFADVASGPGVPWNQGTASAEQNAHQLGHGSTYQQLPHLDGQFQHNARQQQQMVRAGVSARSSFPPPLKWDLDELTLEDIVREKQQRRPGFRSPGRVPAGVRSEVVEVSRTWVGDFGHLDQFPRFDFQRPFQHSKQAHEEAFQQRNDQYAADHTRSQTNAVPDITYNMQPQGPGLMLPKGQVRHSDTQSLSSTSSDEDAHQRLQSNIEELRARIAQARIAGMEAATQQILGSNATNFPAASSTATLNKPHLTRDPLAAAATAAAIASAAAAGKPAAPSDTAVADVSQALDFNRMGWSSDVSGLSMDAVREHTRQVLQKLQANAPAHRASQAAAMHAALAMTHNADDDDDGHDGAGAAGTAPGLKSHVLDAAVLQSSSGKSSRSSAASPSSLSTTSPEAGSVLNSLKKVTGPTSILSYFMQDESRPAARDTTDGVARDRSDPHDLHLSPDAMSRNRPRDAAGATVTARQDSVGLPLVDDPRDVALAALGRALHQQLQGSGEQPQADAANFDAANDDSQQTGPVTTSSRSHTVMSSGSTSLGVMADISLRDLTTLGTAPPAMASTTSLSPSKNYPIQSSIPADRSRPRPAQTASMPSNQSEAIQGTVNTLAGVPVVPLYTDQGRSSHSSSDVSLSSVDTAELLARSSHHIRMDQVALAADLTGGTSHADVSSPIEANTAGLNMHNTSMTGLATSIVSTNAATATAAPGGTQEGPSGLQPQEEHLLESQFPAPSSLGTPGSLSNLSDLLPTASSSIMRLINTLDLDTPASLQSPPPSAAAAGVGTQYRGLADSYLRAAQPPPSTDTHTFDAQVEDRAESGSIFPASGVTDVSHGDLGLDVATGLSSVLDGVSSSSSGAAAASSLAAGVTASTSGSRTTGDTEWSVRQAARQRYQDRFT